MRTVKLLLILLKLENSANCIIQKTHSTEHNESRRPDGKPVDAETMHYHALAALNGEFAEIVTTDGLLA